MTAFLKSNQFGTPSLGVYISVGGQKPVEIFDSTLLKSETMKDKWDSASAWIGRVPNDLHLFIRGISCKNNLPATVALDEFKLDSCMRTKVDRSAPCDGFTCKNGNCIKQYQLCDGQDDCRNRKTKSVTLNNIFSRWRLFRWRRCWRRRCQPERLQMRLENALHVRTGWWMWIRQFQSVRKVDRKRKAPHRCYSRSHLQLS